MVGRVGDDELSVEQLLEIGGASREARAYAFLYATLKQTEIGQNPARDILDCFVPFLSAYLADIKDQQVTAAGIQSYLQSTFGFGVPLYACEQLIGTLKERGLVAFVPGARVHIAKESPSQFSVAKRDIETDFDDLVRALERYAAQVGVDASPASPDWGEALISFLRQSGESGLQKPVSIKSVLIDPRQVEERIVAAFLSQLGERNQKSFSKVVNIYMGVLIEEFIESFSSASLGSSTTPLNVFYDTAVLMRLMGCSGKLLETATLELTTYLDALGCHIFYFSGNEAEIGGILDTIIYRKDSGKEIEGETAAALSSGEITMTELRMLQNSISERLSHLGVYHAGALEAGVLDKKQHQINEIELSKFLFESAVKRGRAYNLENRTHDSGYVAAVMRLRRGSHDKDLLDCGAVFVTQNRLLAGASRRFLIRERALYPQDCAPVLNLAQVATIAWLLKDRKLSPEMASRELLANCYAAVTPDAEWFGYFRQGIEKLSGSLEDMVKVASTDVVEFAV